LENLIADFWLTSNTVPIVRPSRLIATFVRTIFMRNALNGLPSALLTHSFRFLRKPLYALVRGQGRRDVGLFDGRAVAAGNQGAINAVFSQELTHGGRGFRTLDRTAGVRRDQ